MRVRLRGITGARRRLVAAAFVCLTMLLVGTAWALSSPPGSSPDDDFHLASIWCGLGNEPGVCESNSDPTLTRRVPANVVAAPCFARDPAASGACSYNLGDELVPARANEGSYPRLFYAFTHLFVGESVPVAVLSIRLANLALSAALLSTAVYLATPLLRRATALAWLGTAVPYVLFFVPSTNPTSWVVTGLGVYWAFLWRWLVGPPSRGRTAAGVLTVVSAGLAAAARADGAAYLCLVTAAVLVLATPRTQDLLRVRVLLPVFVVLAAIAVYLSAGQSEAIGGIGTEAGLPGRSGLTLLGGNLYNYLYLVFGNFGVSWGLGWLDTAMPPLVGALASAAALIVVTQGSRLRARKYLGLSFVIVPLVVLPLLILQRGGNVVFENVQPRYLLPLIIVSIGLLLVEDGGPSAEKPPRGILLVVLCAGTANLFALQTNIRRYVTGVDVAGFDLDRGREWWWQHLPIGADAVWVIGSVAGFAFFAGLAFIALDRGQGASHGATAAGVQAEQTQMGAGVGY